MRILFVIYSMSNGGAERVVANLANHWSKQGFDVTILTLKHDKCFYFLEPSIKLHCVGSPKNGIFENIQRILAIREYIRFHKIELGISFMTASNVIFSLASIGLKLKKYGSERTYPPKQVLRDKWTLLRKLTYRFLDVVIVQTTDSKEWFKRFIRTKRIEVIANPVINPLLGSNPSVAPYRNGNQKIILAVGRLIKNKGFYSLIQSFLEYEDNLTDHDLYIIGDGHQFEELQSLIIKLKLTNRVHLVGRVGNMADWYKFSDIYVLSSEYEGFPNSLIEAMSFGLPSISMSCHSGPSDIIKDKVNGVLVSDQNYHQLWTEVVNVVNNEELKQKISLNAKKVVDEYSIELISAKWLNL